MQTSKTPGRGKSRGVAAEHQMSFDFAGRQHSPKPGQLHPLDLRRAVLGWLLPQRPTGLGVLVPTRVAKYQADVAAFWATPDRRRVLHPTKTLAVEIRRNREQCWPDCVRKDELLPLLKQLKQEKGRLEAQIRQDEPELQDTDNLFAEFVSWRYAATANPEYPRCLRQIEELEHGLYRGSRFEQIRQAKVADLLYLAVPVDTVHVDELADGWGLLEIARGLVVRETRVAENWDCASDRRMHLAQNIAASCQDSLLFAHGVRVGHDGVPSFTPMPRRRRNPRP